MVSGDSRYDRAFDANGVAHLASALTQQEIDGERVFRQSGCGSCHTTLAQVGDAPHNSGLDAAPIDTGVGLPHLAPLLESIRAGEHRRARGPDNQDEGEQLQSAPKFTSGVKTVTMPMAFGSYTYHCVVHGLAMSGAIIVGK